MKFPGIHMDKALKQTFIGGITGGLIFHMEQAASELVPNYPPVLMQTLTPGLPRNGALLASTGPLAVAWATPKLVKRHPAGIRNIRNGVTFYDGPTIMHQLVRWAAYQAGVSLRTPLALPMGGNRTGLTIHPTIRPTSYPMSSGGRYRASSPPAPSRGYSGVGRYRVS